MKQRHKKKRRLEGMISADISWQGKSASSSKFDDIYFSEHDGIEETQYVFLKQNNLPQAWSGKTDFTILETGFGTGLNFFCTLDQWFKTADDSARLSYISAEKHPVTLKDLKSLLSIWPQYSGYIEALINNYPQLVSGFHPCVLFNGRVKLLLLFGDASEQFSSLLARVDVCFLDGFAPSKNQSMWSEILFKQIARLMNPGGTISTFTAVGDVRRGLQQAGFEMEKADAFGKKRHMLTGTFKEITDGSLNKPWYRYSKANLKDKTVTVIGAGIVGITTAIALYKAGWQVTVVEKKLSVAQGASGNLAGVVMPRMDKEQNDDAIFYWQAYFFALTRYNLLHEDGVVFDWSPSGVIQLGKAMQQKQSDWPDIFLTALSDRVLHSESGLSVKGSASLLKHAAHLNPESLCQNLFESYKQDICFVFGETIEQLSKDDDNWRIKSSTTELESSAVVICNAEAAIQFDQTQHLPVQPVRGQITYLERDVIKEKFKRVICDQGYVIPAAKKYVLGATFKRGSVDTNLTVEDQSENIKQFNEVFRTCSRLQISEEQPLSGRASVRATTSDRMPVVGAVPDQDFYRCHYADLSKGKSADNYSDALYHKGLYINTGHGSRGLTSCFLSAEIISALISNTAVPVEAEALARLHPGRFLIKRYLKGHG